MNSSSHSSSPQIMGIINTTPDSFYDRGRFFEVDKAVARGRRIWDEGADILDVGGESTRPGAPSISAEEEMERVLPVIEALKKETGAVLSIDTRKPEVAEAAVAAGAALINDVAGFRDPKMIEVAAAMQVKICVMHMLGTPETMQLNPRYEEGVVEHLLHWFDDRTDSLCKSGIKESNIIIDPGIGFGKTVEDNLKILHNLQRFKTIGFPILLGVSRKSFMGKIVNKPASELLATTIAMNTLALVAGVDIIRVHDIAEHRDVMKILAQMGVV